MYGNRKPALEAHFRGIERAPWKDLDQQVWRNDPGVAGEFYDGLCALQERLLGGSKIRFAGVNEHGMFLFASRTSRVRGMERGAKAGTYDEVSEVREEHFVVSYDARGQRDKISITSAELLSATAASGEVYHLSGKRGVYEFHSFAGINADEGPAFLKTTQNPDGSKEIALYPSHGESIRFESFDVGDDSNAAEGDHDCTTRTAFGSTVLAGVGIRS